MNRMTHATGMTRQVARGNPAFRRWTWIPIALMPCVALAQTTGHTMQMQDMPGMKMPAAQKHDAGKKALPKKPSAVKPTSHKDLGCPKDPGQASDKSGEKSSTHCKTDSSTQAPVPEGMDHSQMDHSQMEGMDHSQMERMDHSQMEGMDHSQMQMGEMNMQGGPPPADARDPDYSDGIAQGPMTGMDMADNARLLYVLLDNLEYRHGDNGSAQAVDAQAWYGGDRDKLWLKLDGEHEGGILGATRAEALWNRAIATYWDMQLGVRHDFGDGPTRDWAAFGVQGLAPYWFEIEATAYVGQSGRTALRLEAEYEILLSQRLILQPDIEVNLYGKDDPARGIGSGLSDIGAGLRLRYEVTRKFAPYVGVVWSRKFGNTADYTRAAGSDIHDTQLVAGVRIWF